MPPSKSRVPERFHPVVAIIPARGGSKRLPRKALRQLEGGISLLARTVSQAVRLQKRGWLDQIVISTENATIRKVALGIGNGQVESIRRPARLATDTASSLSVIRHAIRNLNPRPKTIVLLQVTSPLRLDKDIVQSLRLFTTRKALKAVITASESHPPPEWTFRFRGNMLTKPVVRSRKARKPSITLNGAVYVAGASHLMHHGFTDRACAFVLMPPERSVDIDTARDLLIAKALLR